MSDRTNVTPFPPPEEIVCREPAPEIRPRRPQLPIDALYTARRPSSLPPLPEDDWIAPTDEALRIARLAIFSAPHDTAEDQSATPRRRQAGLAEKLTVYVMSMTLMVVAFPVGFAMMIYNILAGENLRATARAMALTGVGFAIAGTEAYQNLAALI